MSAMHVQDQKDSDLEQYLISAALIVSGITSVIQVLRFGLKAPPWYHAERIFIGTGLVSLMGTSFTFLPIAQSSIRTMLASAPPCFGVFDVVLRLLLQLLLVNHSMYRSSTKH